MVVSIDEKVRFQIPIGKKLRNNHDFYNHAVSFFPVKHIHLGFSYIA